MIVLVGMVVAFGWPNFAPAARSEELAESVRRIKAALGMCRAQAMNEARRFRFEIRPSGELWITQQLDPLEAPHEYIAVPADWVHMQLLQPAVWVESVQAMPGGPPPIDMPTDEALEVAGGVIEFDEFAEAVVSILALERPFRIDFLPDGSSTSARWVLRDERGRGVQMTLDGRLGRVDAKTVDALPGERAERPKLPEEKEPLAAAERTGKRR